MTPLRQLAAEPAVGISEHAVLALGTACERYDQIGRLRKTLRAPGRDPFPATFLKHSDEQTVVALAAVINAIERNALAGYEFNDWGVLAAARYLGRETTAASIVKFAQEKAWGVSPHIIPHRSLHSLSGTLSQAFGFHGPNFGVGGGPHGASEVLRAVTAILVGGNVPGVWAVMTGWTPEVIPKRADCGDQADGAMPVCRAVAVALQPSPQHWDGARIRVACHGSLNLSQTQTDSPFNAECLFEFLHHRAATSVEWKLGGGGWIEWSGVASRKDNSI